MIHPKRLWKDIDGNIYSIDVASNGKHVVMRTNPGGHRKIVKDVPACKKYEASEKLMIQHANRTGLFEVIVIK